MRRGILIALVCSVFLSTAAVAAEPPAQEHNHALPDATAPLSEEDLPPLGTGPSVQATGALGSYSMMRDASGTSWQPDSSPMEGVHGLYGDWSTMLHGFIAGVYDHQGGHRGDDKVFSESMLMGMAQRPLLTGQWTLHAMLSLDALMGKDGYPLLLQSGETADGKTPLIDRQHPHDVLMELASSYSMPIGSMASVFLYLGYPGEPALGPPTFMHRFSGMANPEAPIGHHWLDSTHITYGVVTAGLVYGEWKIEGSAFNGREPDQHRWGWDPLRLDSASTRLSWNPNENWSLQASYGFIKSPEQLEPKVNQHRLTVSAIYNRKLEHGHWQTTLAWGQNDFGHGRALDAYLLESAVGWYQHTLFLRAENAAKDELFLTGDPLAERVFHVSKVSLGYIYDIALAEHLSLGFGALGSLYNLPAAVEPAYGTGLASYMQAAVS
jgi:opacity protein-like surface antigen